MEYRIEQRGIINGVGVVKNFGKWTSSADAENWEDRMGERWSFGAGGWKGGAIKFPGAVVHVNHK